MVSLDLMKAWICAFDTLIQENAAMLTELDSAIGDADHGANMARGMKAAMQAIEGKENFNAVGSAVGMAMLSKVGGTSGPLYGTFFIKAGKALGAETEAEYSAFVAALQDGLAGIVARGKAELGEKTLVDAMTPALEAMAAADSLEAGAAAALEAANAGRDATTPMLAKKGRASYLGERSIGHQDPGATSTALLFEALAQAAAKEAA